MSTRVSLLRRFFAPFSGDMATMGKKKAATNIITEAITAHQHCSAKPQLTPSELVEVRRLLLCDVPLMVKLHNACGRPIPDEELYFSSAWDIAVHDAQLTRLFHDNIVARSSNNGGDRGDTSSFVKECHEAIRAIAGTNDDDESNASNKNSSSSYLRDPETLDGAIQRNLSNGCSCALLYM